MATSFNWLEYYTLSKEIVNLKCTVTDEAKYRCGVSRAYYAAFKSTLEYAETHNNYVRHDRGKDHSELPKHLEKQANMISTAIALRTLKEYRHQCDYENILVDNPDYIHKEALKEAYNILFDIGLLNNP